MNNNVTPQFTEGPVNADFSGVLQVKITSRVRATVLPNISDARTFGTLLCKTYNGSVCSLVHHCYSVKFKVAQQSKTSSVFSSNVTFL